MKRRLTLTIGIPAYNEQENISRILRDISLQNQTDFMLRQIIVASDGSTDETVREASQFTDLPMLVLENKKRRGKAAVLNQIIEQTTDDVLVILDADTYIFDRNFIRKLISPIAHNKVDLASAKIDELQPMNFLQRLLTTSMRMKRGVFAEHNLGNNLFTCHGRSRAFSKKLYTELRFKNSAGEDAYSYLFCITRGYKYAYVANTSIFYKLPSTFEDHARQSVRYLQYYSQLRTDFSENVVRAAYHLPILLLFKHMLISAVRAPIETLAYLLILVLMKIRSLHDQVVLHQWTMAQTSKELVGQKGTSLES